MAILKKQDRLMIDKDKIPGPTYYELVELFGEEKAEEIILKWNYRFKQLQTIIVIENFVRKLKIQKTRDWVIQKTGIKNPIAVLVTLFFIIWFLILFCLL